MSSEKLICLVGKPRFSPVDQEVVAGTNKDVGTSGKVKNKEVQNKQFEVLAYCIKCSPEERNGLTPKILFQEVYQEKAASGAIGENNINTQLFALNRALNSPQSGLPGLLERLPSLRVDIVEFKNGANALLKTPTSEVARAFMKDVVPLMSGLFLPIEWKQQWVIEWREQIDALYTKALEAAEKALSSESLESRLEMFEKAKFYKTPNTGVPAPSILPKATEIWKKLQLEKSSQSFSATSKSLASEEVSSGEGEALPSKESSEQEREETTPSDALISFESLTGTAVTLLGVVALFSGQAWVKIDLIAKDFLNAVGMSCDWNEEDLEAWGILREYNREVEIVNEIGIGKDIEIASLQNRRYRETYIEAFWQLHKDSREKVWRWFADYGGSEDSTLKLCFALCLKEFIRRCPEGVEMSVLRVWLESPHFPPSPQKDHRNALLALEDAYSEEALREKVYFIIKTWSETHKLPLLQASALLCGRCLSKHHPKEGLDMLESLLEKEGSLVNFIGIALRGYLTGDVEATCDVLDGLIRWGHKMGDELTPPHEIMRIFIMLMNDAPINHDSSLLLKQASENGRVCRLCEDLFWRAILDSKHSEEAWCQFSYWLLYAEQKSQYMDVIKKIYVPNTNQGKRLERYLKLYKEYYLLSYQELIN